MFSVNYCLPDCSKYNLRTLPVGQTLVSSLLFETNHHSIREKSLFLTTNFLDTGIAQNPRTPNNILLPFTHHGPSAEMGPSHLLGVSGVAGGQRGL